MKLHKNAIVGMNDTECEVISALVNPSKPEDMVYVACVAKTSMNPDDIEVLWYYAPQIALKANDNSTAALPTDELPCTLQQIRGMQEFGYQWHGMFPIDIELCLNLLHEGVTVYLLHMDGSESEIVEERDIEDLACVMYGVTVEDWLIYCGRLRDREIVHYGADDEPFEPVPVSSGKFKAITAETGEEIEGYLLRCEGMVNPGKVYICPGVTYATNAYCDENGKRSYDRYAFGSFVEVVADSVRPVNVISDELLMAYRKTGLTPSEIQEAVDLFKDTNTSVPAEIIGWVQRATFHARKCAELEQRIKELEQQLTDFQVREAKTLKEQLTERLADEKECNNELIFSDAEQPDGTVFSKTVDAWEARELALNEAIVSVFNGCDLQYYQLRSLDAIAENKLLPNIKKHLQKGKICYGENEIRDAIYDAVTE